MHYKSKIPRENNVQNMIKLKKKKLLLRMSKIYKNI